MHTADFVKIAEAFRQAKKRLKAEKKDTYPVKGVLAYLMEILQQDNPRFDRDRFIRYINAEV